MVYGLLETVSKFKKNAEFLKSEHFVLELRGCAFLTEPPFRASNCKSTDSRNTCEEDNGNL